MSGGCLWCHHASGAHNGAVDPAVKAAPANAGVRWTTTACAVAGCACRTYEAPKRLRRTK